MDYSKYQTGFQRFAAAIVDMLVFLPLIFITYSIPEDNLIVRLWWGILNSIIFFSYSIFCHYKYGQTVGKWVTKVKVVDISETRGLTLKQAFLRDSFYVLSEILLLIYLAVLILNDKTLEEAYVEYENVAIDPGFYWMLLELITMLFNKKRRAAHDYLAKTVVVKC